MDRNPRKPPLTLEESQRKKCDDWKVRRVLRLVQARDQAHKAAKCVRTQFWTQVDCLTQDMIDSTVEMIRVEEELARQCRANRELKRQQELEHIAEQERVRAQVKADKRRHAAEYADRARERFSQALLADQVRRTTEVHQTEEPAARLKRVRQMENQKSRILAAHHRKTQQDAEAALVPVTMLLPDSSSRDSMVPRDGIPQPSPFISAANLSSVSSLSPLSAPRSPRTSWERDQVPRCPVVLPRVTSQAVKCDVLNESIQRTRKNEGSSRQPFVKPAWNSLVEPTTEAEESLGSVVSLDNEKTMASVERPTMNESLGSVASLDKENIQPVATPKTDSEETDLQTRAAANCVNVAISAQHSLTASSSRDSTMSVDSQTLSRDLHIRAIQLSSPRQLPADSHPRSRLDVPERPPAYPRATSTPTKFCPLPSSSLSIQAISSHSLPSSHLSQKFISIPSLPPTQPVNILQELQDVMKALKLLDANVVGIEMDSFSWSVSTGPLSTPEMKRLESSDESWLSVQMLSGESSSLHSLLTLETGSLFTSTSTTHSNSTLESGPIDLSFHQRERSIAVSILSSGNLDDEVSENDIDYQSPFRRSR